MRIGNFFIMDMGHKPGAYALNRTSHRLCTNKRDKTKVALSDGRKIKYIEKKDSLMFKLELIWEYIKGYRYQGFTSIVKNVLLPNENILYEKEKDSLVAKIEAHNARHEKKINVVRMGEYADYLMKIGRGGKRDRMTKVDRLSDAINIAIHGGIKKERGVAAKFFKGLKTFMEKKYPNIKW